MVEAQVAMTRPQPWSLTDAAAHAAVTLNPLGGARGESARATRVSHCDARHSAAADDMVKAHLAGTTITGDGTGGEE